MRRGTCVDVELQLVDNTLCKLNAAENTCRNLCRAATPLIGAANLNHAAATACTVWTWQQCRQPLGCVTGSALMVLLTDERRGRRCSSLVLPPFIQVQTCAAGSTFNAKGAAGVWRTGVACHASKCTAYEYKIDQEKEDGILNPKN